MSFFADKVVCEDLTFVEVVLMPSCSEVLPREMELSSWFTPNTRIQSPVFSITMDAATDSKIAHHLY